MSLRYPIIATTGSSGSGTTSVKNTFERIFRREGINAAFIEGDAFHRYDRAAMKRKVAEEAARGNPSFSHFGPDANLLDELEGVLKEFSQTGRGRTRQYVHNLQEQQIFGAPQGTFTPWEDFPDDCDLLFYEGLHGAFRSATHDIAQYADMKIGVVPVLNLEWIQKIHRDKETRGYSTEAVTDVILRRMSDYVHYICPQFTETDINFQRVPTVDTSNPFVARWIPTADESMVVIRFRSPRGIDFPYLLSMIHDSFMSRANSIVVPGGKMELAMQLILTPQILRLIDRKNRAV
ncbi:phosphoribulokinase [Methylobrevis pamukkalensis]|uniref:Phosphoribulokinase n=1 Tax=Methylobrevis pamukkalensis TaxID=1439726 RepID=A0A1E3H301_9HYPH|nr:phosphoribulokinase [Methylobrevis pamukkalensis]ODN69921.1 Phosphoribulokinase, chromosomal [Methylobrevis pamukkalensis]